MRSSRSSWLPLLLSLLLTGCNLFGPEGRYYYPTPIEGGGRQLYAWPGSASDEFRFLLQQLDDALGDSHAPAESLHVVRDRERIDALAAQASSITVLLPEDSDPNARGDAQALIARLSSARPELSTHCVAIRTDVRSVESGVDLHRVLTREGAFHEESRPAGIVRSFMGALGKAWAMTEHPNFVVVPLESGADRWVVYGDLRILGEAATAEECTSEQVPEVLRPRLLDPQARQLKGTWGDMDSGGRTTISITGTGSVFVAVYLPQGIPPDRRAECEALASRLCAADLAPIVIAQADTNWEWSACTSAEFVRKQLPLDGDKSYIAGPVRQWALLPQPSKEKR